MPKPLTRTTRVIARVLITLAGVGFFLVLRPDAPDVVRADYRRWVASPRIISDYMKATKVRKLQLGAGGNNVPGWLNTDIDVGSNQAYVDAAKPFPFSDGSINYVFSEHVIEHLTYEQGLGMLKECRRVLVPGGKMRIVTPNLLKFINLFQQPKTEAMRTYIDGKLGWHSWPRTPEPETYILNRELRDWGHQFVYTPTLLRANLESVGFADVREFLPGRSDDPALSNIEFRAGSNVTDVNDYEAMALEAIRR